MRPNESRCGGKESPRVDAPDKEWKEREEGSLQRRWKPYTHARAALTASLDLANGLPREKYIYKRRRRRSDLERVIAGGGVAVKSQPPPRA